MRVLVITPPEPVVSLDQAKAHLHVDRDDEDALIEGYIEAATGELDGPDGWLGRCLGPQTIEVELGAFDCSIRLPCPPIIDVVSVQYVDADRALQTLAADQYELHDRLLIPIEDVEWPRLYSGRYARDFPLVRVRYRAGYVADAAADPLVAAVPWPIRAAILLMVGDKYANREIATVPAMPVASLLAPFRLYG